jgi:LuxR family maltose regulon positive regulatory protein
MSPALFAFSAPQEIRMALELGEYAKATEAADRLARVLGDCAETRVLRATIHEGRRRRDDARRLLEPVLDGTVAAYVPSTLVTAWLLEASLAAAADEQYRAFEALERAVAWAAPNEAIRPFLDAPPGIRVVLAANAGRFGRWNDFVDLLLRRLPAGAATGAVGDGSSVSAEAGLLTRRELELLRDLPSMMSIEEIASARAISVNTTKSHLRALYRKLGVNTRRDAVTLARTRGLL